jgi:hypothetical protein
LTQAWVDSKDDPIDRKGRGEERSSGRFVTWPTVRHADDSNAFVLTTVPVALPQEWFVTGSESCAQEASLKDPNFIGEDGFARLTETALAMSLILCLVSCVVGVTELMFWVLNA